MRLIREQVQPDEIEFLVEDAPNGKKEHFIQGVFLQAEVKNKNGRIYPLGILANEVNRYNAEYVQKNRAFGELGHPDSPQINLDRVSHMITTLRPEGTNFVGKAKILDTPNGKIVKSLLEGGARLGVSTRGVGSLRPQGGFQLVQDDFRLATAADIVADPSAPDAFVQGIMEGQEWMLTDHGWQPYHLERAKKLIRETSRADIESTALKIFSNFISKL